MSNNVIKIFKAYTLEQSFSKKMALSQAIKKEFKQSLRNDDSFNSLLSAIFNIKDPSFQYQIFSYLKVTIAYLGKDNDSDRNLSSTELMNAVASFMYQVAFIYSSQFDKSFYADYQKEAVNTLCYLYKNNELLSLENSTSFKKLLAKTSEIHREAKKLKPELITSNGYY